MNKGGDFRKWFGNNEWVINYENNGKEIKDFAVSIYKCSSRTIQNTQYYFKSGLTWSALTSGNLSVRLSDEGFLFGSGGYSAFADSRLIKYILALMNNKVGNCFLQIVSQTMNYEVGHIKTIPVIFDEKKKLMVEKIVDINVLLSRQDWDSFETSWDFIRHPFVRKGATRICDTWAEWEQECLDRFNQLKANEEELNRIFIDIYGLQDELTPEEDDSDVTVRKADLARDMRSFVSYSVGCMFGRYSLDVSGLAYAGGDWDSSKYRSFVPDEDNVIPVLDDEWFKDDIVGRFKKFVRTVFGSENYDANMNFIEKALGKNIRDYFMKDFYKDHLKVYQKRPIYWMFSSPEGSFNVLVYLHRYNKDTANVVLKYMRDYRTKIQAQLEVCKRNHDPEEIKYQRIDKDLEKYDSVLYSLALKHVDLDLDDGVKVNYGKIGEALFPVEGLNKEKK